MATNFKLTTRKMIAHRKQKAAFKKLTTEREKYEFLANAEPFPLESWLTTSPGMSWWPALGGMLIVDESWKNGFTTPEAAYDAAVILKADYAKKLLAQPA